MPQRWHPPYRVVRLDPSSLASDSIVMACAGQMASQSLQASTRRQRIVSPIVASLTDTSLLAVGVSPQSVLASESGGHGSLFERVHDGIRWSWVYQRGSLHGVTDCSLKNCSRTSHIPGQKLSAPITKISLKKIGSTIERSGREQLVEFDPCVLHYRSVAPIGR